jgi:hypothetical protein
MTTVSYKTGVIEVAPNVYAFIQENCATNAGFIVEEARELLQILNTEMKRGNDEGLPEYETAKRVNVGKFSGFANQKHVGQITQMAYQAYRGELE